MTAAMKLYSRAPYPAKVWLAGVRGRRLNRVRYPKGSEALVTAALERDKFDVQEWNSWQSERLSLILGRALAEVPYYRRLWAAPAASKLNRADALSLENWPTLEKHHVRQSPTQFVADDRPRRSLHTVGTSGTSGTPLVIYRRADDSARHYAIYEARVRRWNGVSRKDNWAALGGQLVVPFARETPPFWVQSRPLNQLYLSTNHLKPAFAAAYARQLEAFAPTHIVAYPSSMVALAQMVLDQQLDLPRPRVLISNAEPLLDAQRATLRQAFGCETRDTYGMGEGAASAAECKHGSLHVSPDNGIVEILDDDNNPVPDGSVGEIVVTGLVNESMILIRYRTGDRGALAPTRCSCGLATPVIDRLEGRVSDLIQTPDGRQVFWLNPVFAGLPLVESQIVQPSIDRLEVRVVTNAAWADADAAELRERLRERVGDMDINIVAVTEIERGPNGKFRPVLSLLNRPTGR